MLDRVKSEGQKVFMWKLQCIISGALPSMSMYRSRRTQGVSSGRGRSFLGIILIPGEYLNAVDSIINTSAMPYLMPYCFLQCHPE